MKKLEINIPEGHEIDLDKSNLSKGIVFFKEVKRTLTYEGIANKLFSKKTYWITDYGQININQEGLENYFTCYNSNNADSREQLESILALNKLCNVAKYLNGDWLPRSHPDYVYYIQLGSEYSKISKTTSFGTGMCLSSIVYFKTKELAQQAIEILGEKEIRKALTLNH